MEPSKPDYGILRRRYRQRWLTMMRRFYGPEWWRLYLRIARELRRSQNGRTDYLALFDSFGADSHRLLP